MKKKYSFLFILCLVLCCACDNKIDLTPYEYQLVVEGSIENEKYASVLLSYSVGFAESLDTLSLLNHIIHQAKVTISDGEREEVLLLRPNHNRVPPYEYITTDIMGEVGKSYFLKVEVNKKIYTSETFIPQPVEIDSLWYVKEQEQDTSGYIHIRFKNESKHTYLLSTKIAKEEKVFIPSLYGYIENTDYKPDIPISLQINRGATIYPKHNFVTSFPDTAVVQVKLSTLGREGFDFWKSYQNELINAQNPIFPSSKPLKSNINGGVGIWAGYGSTIQTIDLNPNN